MLTRVGTRCLIVDDNPRFLRSARNLLRRQGVSVIGIASNGGDAIAIAAADRPDVALVDLDLGDEDGLDVARALATAQVPVILISAYGEQDLQGVLEGSTALGFLPKSVVSRQAIDDLLRRVGEGREPGSP
jgi:DNA-binding NarL/FixJ family response regulator